MLGVNTHRKIGPRESLMYLFIETQSSKGLFDCCEVFLALGRSLSHLGGFPWNASANVPEAMHKYRPRCVYKLFPLESNIHQLHWQILTFAIIKCRSQCHRQGDSTLAGCCISAQHQTVGAIYIWKSFQSPPVYKYKPLSDLDQESFPLQPEVPMLTGCPAIVLFQSF